MDIAFRGATPADAAAVAGVYNPYVLGTTISFEERQVSVEEMAGRIAETVAAGLPWLVAESPSRGVLGYAYASRWKGRSAYRRTVESAIYLAGSAAGRGLGSRLYGALLEHLRAMGMHAVIGGIAQPNGASVALHEKLGFRKVAHFAEIGFKFGKWIDVGYWQLNLG